MTAHDDIEAHLQAGRYAEAARAAHQAGQLERARDLYEKIWDFAAAARCAREAGDLPGALGNLIDSRDGDGELEVAAKLALASEPVRRAAARVYEDRRRWNEAAALHEGLGDTERALALFKKGGLFLSAARLCERTGAWRDAGQLYERSLEETTGKEALAAHLALGRILARLGQPEAATKHLQEAARAEDRDPLARAEILRLLVVELTRLGLFGAAHDAARRAHDLDPASPLDPRALLEAARAPSGDEPVLAGRYRLSQLLGSGLSGRVHLARDELSGAQVAIKIFVASQGADRDAYARFVREARLFAQLRHPNVVEVLDFHEDLGFFVMEYMSAGTLADRLRPRLAAPQVKRVALELVAALEFAHQHGVVHRDIKPMNVLYDARGSVKLGDFGVAHLLDLGQTQTGGLIGTLAYMSPEQITGAPLTFAADLYGLGVTLFQALTGRLPFLGPDFVAEHLGARAPRTSETCPEVSVAWDALLGRLLEKDPAARHGSTGELRREIDAISVATTTSLLVLPRRAASEGPQAASESLAAVPPEAPQASSPSLGPDRYQAEVALGATPVSQLHRGVDIVLARSVVIERFHEGHPDAQEERRLLGLAAALGPHLQHVLKYDRPARTVVYQAPVGQPLSLLRDALPPMDMARLLLGLAAALAPAHEAGIAHGNVDKGHVVMDEEGSPTLLVAGLLQNHEDCPRDLEDCLHLALVGRDVPSPGRSCLSELLRLATPYLLVPAAADLARAPIASAYDLRHFAERLAHELRRADRTALHIQALVTEASADARTDVLARIHELALGHGLPETRVRALVPTR